MAAEARYWRCRACLTVHYHKLAPADWQWGCETCGCPMEPVVVLPVAEYNALMAREIDWERYNVLDNEVDRLRRLEAAVEYPDIEHLAQAVHGAYCDDYMAQKGEHYWTHGDYSRLDDKSKETDRATVQVVLAALRAARDGGGK